MKCDQRGYDIQNIVYIYIYIYSAFFGLDNKKSGVVYEFMFTRIKYLSMTGMELLVLHL